MPTILDRRFLSMCFEVFEMMEEVALQRPCLAIAWATRMLAWVRPDPPGLERSSVTVG